MGGVLCPMECGEHTSPLRDQHTFLYYIYTLNEMLHDLNTTIPKLFLKIALHMQHYQFEGLCRRLEKW